MLDAQTRERVFFFLDELMLTHSMLVQTECRVGSAAQLTPEQRMRDAKEWMETFVGYAILDEHTPLAFILRRSDT